jgi:hypothetical protein
MIFITLQLLGLATFYNYMTISGKAIWNTNTKYGQGENMQGFKLKPNAVPPRLSKNPIYSTRISEEKRILALFEKALSADNNHHGSVKNPQNHNTTRHKSKKQPAGKEKVVKVPQTLKGGKKSPKRKPPYPIFYREKDLKLLPPISAKDVKIPHIIHQTWKNYNIPYKFQDFVRSWAKKHPGWQYWFWTDHDADMFVRKRFPEHHRLFTNYRKPILKADAIRYFILYEFGGVYADLDMEVLRNIDVFTRKHYCIIASEPFIHAAFYGTEGMEYIACNALMAAAPRHAFFKLIIDNLADRARKQKYVLAQTGPKMVTDLLDIYKNRTKYTREDTVYLADAKYFMPQPAEDNAKKFQEWCKTGKVILTEMTKRQKSLCISLKINERKSLLLNVLPNDTYTVHKWMHSYHKGFQVDRLHMQSIFMLVPHVSNMRNIIENMTKV